MLRALSTFCNRLKKLSLTIVLDAYVTKNAIEDFLSKDWSEFREQLVDKKRSQEKADDRMGRYRKYLEEELDNINCFLYKAYLV